MANKTKPKSRAKKEDRGVTKKHSPIHRKSAHRGHAPTNVADAVVIKDEDLFFLCDSNGDVPLGNDQGFGLYYHDCRFLKGYRLRIAGVRPNSLSSTSEHGFMSEFVLTNPHIRQSDGAPLPEQSIGIKWLRIIDSRSYTLQDVIELTNFSAVSARFQLSFEFQAGFADIFEIRGLQPSKIGRAEKPSWKKGALLFEYDGADGLYRSLQVSIRASNVAARKTGATVNVVLEPGKSNQVQVSLSISESSANKRPAQPRHAKSDSNRLANTLHHNTDEWLRNQTRMTSSNPLLNLVFDRCLRDLRVLKASLDGQEYYSAGLPWYGALFGRDSIISSLQTLAFKPRIAEQTLRLLAEYQAKKSDEWRDEQPGKILHELRVGELAHLNEIPQTPYYGSVDSTPLFLTLLARYINWTGDLSLWEDLRQSANKAFDWITRYGDESGRGYLEYRSKSSQGLGNQGWKDSGDSIVNADGSLATPPIALVEVQGYVYMAKLEMADLYERTGDKDASERLRAEAHELRQRFERDFWLEHKNIYALALQANGKPAAVVSSNAGQLLWSGIAEPRRAASTAEQLMSPGMFTGWGVRTLSSQEQRYNPVGYHLGTVWPHDNSIVAAGLRMYGWDDAACRIFEGIFEAASHFRRYRLPEVFAGYSKSEYPVPVRYPVACHPQAWAAGSVPFMLESLLGLRPNALERRLHVIRPALPGSVEQLELCGLKVGSASADLRFTRDPNGKIRTDVLKVEGSLDVEVSDLILKAA